LKNKQKVLLQIRIAGFAKESLAIEALNINAVIRFASYTNCPNCIIANMIFPVRPAAKLRHKTHK